MSLKILITGSTASQTSPRVSDKSPTFAGLLKFVLECDNHSVFWKSPSMKMTKEELDDYDIILVGLSPISSLSSYSIYGSLSVIDHALSLGKLKLYLDAPEPYKIYASYRDILNNPENLIKPFYSTRREYALTQDPDEFSRLLNAVRYLHNNPWDNLIIPGFPWSRADYISASVPNVVPEKTNVLCLDSAMFLLENNFSDPSEGFYWCSDALGSKWSRQISKTLEYPVEAFRAQKWDTHASMIDRLSSSIGVLISVYKDDDPWWSILLSQALFAGVPVVTDWRLSGYLGMEWLRLPSSIEDMYLEERMDLAVKQRELYRAAIPSWNDTVNNTVNAVFHINSQKK